MINENMTNFWKNKRITVTGGEGFLGGHLIKFLKKKILKKFQ